MNISIETFWFYGYKAHELGKTTYNAETRTTKFSWSKIDSEVYDSAWLACTKLNVFRYGLLCEDIDGEHLIGVRIHTETVKINPIPRDELPKKAEGIKNVLTHLGFKDLPEPQLYFMVMVDA